ncbi:MAG: hypothetical protein ACTSRG_17845 [Candidatus Helarchaeota archaeon]
MTTQIITPSRSVNLTTKQAEDLLSSNKKLGEAVYLYLNKKGYKPLNSLYFNSLRHNTLYYKVHYFHADPETKIAVVDILVVHPFVGKKKQLITELELLDRSCQKIKRILISEYHNISHIFNENQFNNNEYRFLHLIFTKKLRHLPYYGDSKQVLFSIKPIVVTLKGEMEYDMQKDSRIDIVPGKKLKHYLPLWHQEVLNLGKKVYNKRKFSHFQVQQKFDKWVIFSVLLYLIPFELNLILQWNIWAFSIEVVIFLGVLANILLPVHSYLRYRSFDKICKEEILTNKWIEHCNYLMPFLNRSDQLLLKPLEKEKGKKTTLEKIPTDEIHQLFSEQHIKENQPQQIKLSPKVQQIQEMHNTNPETTQIETTNSNLEAFQNRQPKNEKPKSAGIKRLLKKNWKSKVNLEIYKSQIGDNYAKLKITTDFNDFKTSGLKIIQLILAAEWFKLTGRPPVNIRIREISDQKIDYYKQIETLLSRFLEKYPDKLNIEEFYRLATMVDVGQLNNQMIDLIELKLEKWLLEYELLPQDKLKVLQVTQNKRINSNNVLSKRLDKIQTFESKKEPDIIEKAPKKVEMDVKYGTEISEGNEISTLEQNKIMNEEAMKSSATLIANGTRKSIVISDQDLIKNMLEKSEEETEKQFSGEIFTSYYRFKHIIEGEGYRDYAMPICVLGYDSRDGTNPLDEYLEVIDQMPGIAQYIIFDLAKCDSTTVTHPIESPTIWLKDAKLNLNETFPFSTSTLAERLSTIKNILINGDFNSPILPETTTQVNNKPFEQIPQDSPNFDVLDDEILDNDLVLKETIKVLDQTAKILEAEEQQVFDTDQDMIEKATRELEIHEVPNEEESQKIVTYNPKFRKGFKGDNLFQVTDFSDNGVVIDANNLLLSFLTALELFQNITNMKFDFYLLEVLDRVYTHFTGLGYGPIVFFTDSDFYLYLLPEPKKSQKLGNSINKKLYYSYTATKDEYDFYNRVLRRKCFVQAIQGQKADELLLPYAKTYGYQIVSNDQFKDEEYKKYWDYVSKNRISFEITQSVITFRDALRRPIGDRLYLLELPDELAKKVEMIVSEQKNANNLEPETSRLITNEPKNNQTIKTIEKKRDIDQKKVVPRLEPKDVSISDISNPILDIVFGVFHTKIGGIPIYPLCKNCENELLKEGIPQDYDIETIIRLANCKCPLPNSKISHKTVQKHINTIFSTEGFNTVNSDKYSYSGWEWSLNFQQASRTKLSWAIIIYWEPKNPKINENSKIAENFLRNYKFDFNEDLESLISQGYTNLEFDKQFYRVLYDHLVILSAELMKLFQDLS